MPPKKSAKRAREENADGDGNDSQQVLARENSKKTTLSLSKDSADMCLKAGMVDPSAEEKSRKQLLKIFPSIASDLPIFEDKKFQSENDFFLGSIGEPEQVSRGEFDSTTMLKFVTWNIVSMKSFTSKEFHGKKNALEAFLLMHQPDVLCLQETKISTWEECKSSFFPLNSLCAQMYSHVDSIADVQNGGASKGYSGTRTYIKKKQKWSSGKDSLSQTKANKHEENASFKINDAQHKFGFEHPVAQDGESIEHGKHDPDGRGITTFLDIHWSNECKPETIAVVNTYVPNSGLDSLPMMDYRINTFDTKLKSL